MPRERNRPIRGGNSRLLPQLAFFIVIDFLVVVTIYLALHNITMSQISQPQITNHLLTTTALPVTTVAVSSGAPVLGPQVLNISLNIINDEIVGRFGYWALANYTRTVKAYRILNSNSSNSYFLIVSLNGTWRTFAGALSPSNGTMEPDNGSGPFRISYSAIEDYPLNTTARLKGYIGQFNLNGTASDIVRGRYANQTGISPSTFHWTEHYFGFLGGLNITRNYTAVFRYSPGNQEYVIIINQTGLYTEGDILT